MELSDMLKLFHICIGAGIAIPLFSLFLGAAGDLFQIDFDFDGDFDFDTPFPITIMSVSFACVIFGAVGKYFINKVAPPAVFFIAGVFAVLGAYLLGRFVIRPLKTNKSGALKIEELKGQKGVIKLEVRQNFTGTVTVLSSIGSKITYDARPAEGIDKIKAGTEVLIVDVKERICIVTPFVTIDQKEGIFC